VDIGSTRGRGLEAAAREARRAAFGSLRADVLMLAHHRDDQAETVLFRLLRGAGVKGAAGMLAEARVERARADFVAAIEDHQLTLDSRTVVR
jgi:tRNA(Ile)-lysidine synthase